MYGASGKRARRGGGVGSAGKRKIHAPPIRRPATADRLPMGRGAVSSAAVSNSPSASLVEESFSLVRENPLNFGMAIRLAPNLVEEIKRVEAQGGTARIKFDANAKNPNGNVIQVGDKTFRFTWSREPGDFCDIYEERQSGGDGNSSLVESGATWRKLNVERELDESTKNHVKRRSEEAERKLKSRRAIVLDHQIPSRKNQLKDLAAAESNTWRNFKHRKEPPFKKLKSEPPSAGGPSRSVYKSGLPPTGLSKVRFSSGSPLSSQLEHHGGSVSPVGSGNSAKEHASLPDAAIQNKKKPPSSDKEMGSRLPNSPGGDKFKRNQNTEAKSTDSRSLIISLLLKHKDKGMNLKALEKAIGDSIPNSVRQIEPILKQVATYQAPGKYFLKPGLEMESFKKPQPQIGSSPEISRHESPKPKKLDQHPTQDHSFSLRIAASGEEPGELNSTPLHTIGTSEKIDILGNSPDQFRDKNVFSSNGGLVGSSSDSGSDSDSDSGNSGWDNGSHRGKSESPVGSPSGRSTDSDSDSETDATSSSEQAADDYVDIMTSDDDKECQQKLQDSDLVLYRSTQTWNNQVNEYVDIGNYDIQDDRVSDLVDIENDSLHDAKRPSANYSVPNEGSTEPIKEFRTSSYSHHEFERQDHDRKAHDGSDHVVNDGFMHGKTGTVERSSKGKSKRSMDDKHSDERAHNKKKLKCQNLSQPISGTLSSLFGESRSSLSPDKPEILDRGAKYSERSFQSNEGLQTHRGFNAEGQRKGGLVSEKRPMKFSAEGFGTESNYRESEVLGKVKKATSHSPGHHIEVGSQLNKGPDICNQSRFAEARTDLGPISDSYEDTSKKVPLTQESDSIQRVGSYTTKENKKRKPSMAQDSNYRERDDSLKGSDGASGKNKESSMGTGNSPYTKYEKEQPELKGPVQDLSQYREYVKEYQVKYETYSSMNKILESYREEFGKLGKHLEACKDRDMKRYNEILEQMRLSYLQCGESHKRLKKTFVVLYEELKHLKQMIKEYATSYRKN